MNEHLSVKEIQSVLQQIMKYIHDFCVENDIKYSLDGGTLIGAIRHKGFIPWDDDIDIAIPRPYYDKFVKTFNDSDEYKLFAPERGNSYINYARVCDVKSTIGEFKTPWTKEDVGVWIDVFPIDGEAEEEEVWKKEVDRVRLYRNWAFFSRLPHSKFKREATPLENFKVFWKKVLFWELPTNFINKKLVKLQSSHDFWISSYCVQMAFLAMWTRKRMPRHWYDCEYVLQPFEDTDYYITSEYDNVLKSLYGDYMKLPPEEDRVAGHSQTVKYYWKET